MSQEVWKDIPGWRSCYQASNLGNIRSIDRVVNYRNGQARRHQGRILKARTQNWGYMLVGLSKSSKHYWRYVHRLVAMTFLGKPPTAQHEINHKNGEKEDNRASNLEWCTRGENKEHAARLGLLGNMKLNTKRVKEIRRRFASGESYLILAKEFGVAPGYIHSIIRKEKWSHV